MQTTRTRPVFRTTTTACARRPGVSSPNDTGFAVSSGPGSVYRTVAAHDPPSAVAVNLVSRVPESVFRLLARSFTSADSPGASATRLGSVASHNSARRQVHGNRDVAGIFQLDRRVDGAAGVRGAHGDERGGEFEARGRNLRLDDQKRLGRSPGREHEPEGATAERPRRECDPTGHVHGPEGRDQDARGEDRHPLVGRADRAADELVIGIAGGDLERDRGADGPPAEEHFARHAQAAAAGRALARGAPRATRPAPPPRRRHAHEAVGEFFRLLHAAVGAPGDHVGHPRLPPPSHQSSTNTLKKTNAALVLPSPLAGEGGEALRAG